MKKALIFGTGENMFHNYKKLMHSYEIVGFIDNDEKKQGNKIGDCPIVSINDIDRFVYDCIIVTPSSHRAVCQQLREVGFPEDKIILLRDISEYPQYKSGLSLAFILSGNITDYLSAANYIWIFKNKLLSERDSIDIYCKSNSQYAQFVFGDGKEANRVYDYDLPYGEYREYDLVAELSPYPKILHNDKYFLSRLSHKTVDYLLDWEKFRILYGQVFGDKPFMQNRLTVYQKILGCMWLQTPDINKYLNVSEKYEYSLPIFENVLQDEIKKTPPFITICSIPNNNVLDWSNEYWNEIKEWIKISYKDKWLVDIVGESNDEYLTEWTMGTNQLHRTLNIHETAVILKQSRLVVATDIPLIHLRYAMHGGISVVLFGPTSEEVNGCPGNINIRGIGCKHWCEGVTSDWDKKCVRREEFAPCMASISPKLVINEIEAVLNTTAFS